MGTYIAIVAVFILICLVVFFAEKYRMTRIKYRHSQQATVYAMTANSKLEVDLAQKKGELFRAENKIAKYKEALETIRDYTGETYTLPLSFIAETDNCHMCDEFGYCQKHAIEHTMIDVKLTISALRDEVCCAR